MNEGYVKLWRKSKTSNVFKNIKVWYFWSWCLMEATYKPIEILINHQLVKLEPGQFIFGRKKCSKEISLSEREIRTCLTTLSKMGNMTIKPTNKFTIITICNWETYQSNEIQNDQQNDQQKANKRPTKDHKQEVKEVKEDKEIKNKDKILFGDSVLLTEIEYQKLCERFGKEKTDDQIENLEVYSGMHPKEFKAYTSHYRAIIGYFKLDEKRKGIPHGINKKNNSGIAGDGLKKQDTPYRTGDEDD